MFLNDFLASDLIYLDRLRIVSVACKTEGTIFLLLCCQFWARFFFLEFFYSICIFQSVERLFAANTSRRNVSDHSRLRIADEGILKHLSQFTATKGCMFLVLV